MAEFANIMLLNGGEVIDLKRAGDDSEGPFLTRVRNMDACS
ncbi:MAG: hypothetical protein AAGG72_09490 [Pseudomonadota bacterium]